MSAKEFEKRAQSFVNNVLFGQEYVALVEGNKNIKKHWYELGNEIRLLDGLSPPRFETMRLHLDGITKHGAKLEKFKEVKSSSAAKKLASFLALARKRKAEVVREERQYEKQGKQNQLVEVDIIVNATDYNNDHVDRATLRLTVDSMPKKVTLTESMSKGSARFRGIMVEPNGTAHVELFLKRKVNSKVSNNLIYRKLIQGGTLAIVAKEETVRKEKTETTGNRAIKSANVKGSAGIDFKVFKSGVELTSGEQLEESQGGSVKFTILSPKGTLDVTQK